MSSDSKSASAAMKHAVIVDGARVIRSISANDIRAYLIQKGFRLASRYTGMPGQGADLHTLVPEEDFNLGAAVMQVADYPGGAGEFRVVTARIAEAIGRPHEDVLREIAGEVLTIEAAKDALIAAFEAVTGQPYVAPVAHGFGASTPFDVVQEMIELAEMARSAATPAWHRVAEAAEDVAAIALDTHRAKRASGPAPSSPT